MKKTKPASARIEPVPPIEIPSALERMFPEAIFEKAKRLAGSKGKLLAEGEKLKDQLTAIKTIDDLLDLPVAEADPEKKIVFILALIIVLAQEGQVRKCDCSKELAALQAAQARLQRAVNALQQAQANLANAQAQLAAAAAAERAAWQAYSAASRLTQRVCSGIGVIDPLCLVAITYETLLGNKWAIRQQQLQNAQQAVLNAQRLVRQAEALVRQALRRFNQALLAYILCLIRCLFGF